MFVIVTDALGELVTSEDVLMVFRRHCGHERGVGRCQGPAHVIVSPVSTKDVDGVLVSTKDLIDRLTFARYWAIRIIVKDIKYL